MECLQMMRKFIAIGGLSLLLLTATSCQKLQARDNLTKGIHAFNEAKYEKAAEYFSTASKLDPDLTNAELYLATAYTLQAQFLDPSMTSDDSKKFANSAIETFEKVLQKDPKNASAIGGLAGLYQGLKNFDKSREYYRKQTEIEPNNAVPYYAIASTDWIMIRDRSHPLTDDEKAMYAAEGLEYVDKALEKNPEYQEAMTYKNLLLREKAAITKDPAEAKKLVDEANVWFEKALAQLKINAEKKSAAATK
jgi:tetratricopeptide (TPR) repeat protein